MGAEIRAYLTPDEDRTLRLISDQSPRQNEFRITDVARLYELGLIHLKDGGWHPTKAGEARAKWEKL